MTDEFEEKRRYFRVNDKIHLLHRALGENDRAGHSYVSADVLGDYGVTAALDVLNQEAAALTPRLERRDPELLEYLKIIESKINLLTQAVAGQDNKFSGHDKRDVNLSASGLAFGDKQEIPVGTVLELRMLLTSSLAVVVAYGRVVSCKDVSGHNPEHPFEICVDYINMNEDDRELLIKYVIKKQMQQLREKKER
ncbi:PilZ domain-containing protein [Methylomonas sp. MgM2]